MTAAPGHEEKGRSEGPWHRVGGSRGANRDVGAKRADVPKVKAMGGRC